MPQSSEFQPPSAAARDSVLQFASLVSGQNNPSAAMTYAVERGWLDAGGNPTPAGIELDRALADQAGTRSAFRGT
jgi:hypothetical protein